MRLDHLLVEIVKSASKFWGFLIGQKPASIWKPGSSSRRSASWSSSARGADSHPSACYLAAAANGCAAATGRFTLRNARTCRSAIWILTERGYSVELAASADEALALLQRDGGFDAMLVDYVMPGTNGASLAQIVGTLRPGLRILMMTGHAELRAGEEIGTENIIRKPFNVATLDERLARVLARPVFQAVQGGVAAGVLVTSS